MKQLLIAFSFILSLLLFVECEKKETTLDVVESDCKDFEISNPSYVLSSNSICGNEPGMFSVDVFFDYDGEEDCLDNVQFDALRFIDKNGDNMSGVGYERVISANSDTLMVSSNEANATLCFQFDSEAELDNLDHILMDFHTENELGNESRMLSMRVNTPNASVPPADSDLDPSQVDVEDNQVTMALWDDAAEDGDIISMALNGEWVIDNFQIFNEDKTRYVTLNMSPGNNELIFYAVNEGDSPPNTGQMTIDDGFTVQEFNIQMKKYETKRLIITVQ